MDHTTSLVKSNIEYLEQAVNLIQKLGDKEFTRTDTPHFSSSIGEHLRHIIEHYTCLLDGMDQRVDYDARKRDSEVETDPERALETYRRVIRRLKALQESPELLNRSVEVKSKSTTGVEETAWAESSIARELQYMVSHTVHHFALIAVSLDLWKISLPKGFGVAPSTLRHRELLDSNGDRSG